MTDKIGLTIEEAADYTGIGRNTMRKLVEWEKIPVLRIGRRYIIRIDVIHKFMEANQGADLLVREQVRAVRLRTGQCGAFYLPVHVRSAIIADNTS